MQFDTPLRSKCPNPEMRARYSAHHQASHGAPCAGTKHEWQPEEQDCGARGEGKDDIGLVFRKNSPDGDNRRRYKGRE